MTKPLHSLPRRRGYTLEHDAQVALIRWARLMEPQYPALANLFSIPNGGWRHITTASSLRDEGVKPGAPDLVLLAARHGYHTLCIEMKRLDAKPKNPQSKGPLSDAQVECHEDLRAEHNLVRVCYGSGEAINWVKWYLGIL